MHDFGLASWNVVALEDHLKLLLKDMAVLRAQWPMKPKKLRKNEERLEEMTLGGLITQYSGILRSFRRLPCYSSTVTRVTISSAPCWSRTT